MPDREDMKSILEACRKTGPMDERLVRGTVESNPRNSEEYHANAMQSHGYSTNYVQITFNDNVDFDEWIGRYACLCALTGEPVADIVMRSIKIDT